MLSALLWVNLAHGQTIRETVQSHVEESLEKEKEKTRTASESADKDSAEDAPVAAASDDSPSQSSNGAATATTTRTAPSAETKATTEFGLPLPLRVINDNFQLDLTVGVGYRGWAPQQYPSVSVTPANFFTWNVGASARFFKVVSLEKAWYESNNAASPRKSYLADAAKYGSWALKGAWFLAELGIDALKNVEPLVRYETRSFMTHARAAEETDVCIVPFDQDADTSACETEDKEMTITSSMETAALGVKFHPAEASAVINGTPASVPSLFVGAGYLSYLKPYQVTVGEYVLEDYLFTGRFYGGGLALGIDFGGGINRPYVDGWLQMGLGRVRLTEDMTLNELTPDDWLIGYIQGNVQVSFRWAPFSFAPTLLIVPSGTFSGASFFFFETEVNEGEEISMPGINWDLLYTVRLSIVLTL